MTELGVHSSADIAHAPTVAEKPIAHPLKDNKLYLRRGTAITLAAATAAMIAACGPGTQGVTGNQTPDRIPTPPGQGQDVNSETDTNVAVAYPEGSAETQVSQIKKTLTPDQQSSVTTDLSAMIQNDSSKEDPYELPSDYKNLPQSTSIFKIISTDGASLEAVNKQNNEYTPEQEYHVLEPIVMNPIVKSALVSGAIDKVIVRVFEDPKITMHTGSFYGPEKTLYIFLPQQMNSANYRLIATHETLHSLAALSATSGFQDALPSQQEFNEWQNACGAVREIASEQAGSQMNEIVDEMSKNASLFSDNRFNNAFQEVLTALKEGKFNELQPGANNYPEGSFNDKVPNCSVIGPQEAFFILLSENGLEITQDTIDSIFTPEQQKILGNMNAKWVNIIGNQTIYKYLREDPYMAAAGGTLDKDFVAGHPYSWDELVSLVNVASIASVYPDAFAQVINDSHLTPDQKDAVINLVKHEFDMLKQVTLILEAEATDDNRENVYKATLELRIKLQMYYDIWRQKIAAN